ncbi:hypothetical protein [Flavihumibacter petaseus]|nr:hypothetical protein [Flavihumibacter petaseus]
MKLTKLEAVYFAAITAWHTFLLYYMWIASPYPLWFSGSSLC